MLALPVRFVRPPPLRLLLRMQAKGLVRCLPRPAGHPGVDGGRSVGDRSTSGRDRSPRPGPSGLGSGLQSSLVAGPSRSEYGGHSSPAPSGAAEDNRCSTFNSVNMDRDASFRSVLRLIREFHSLEEPAIVAPNRCKTSLAQVYRLQSVFPGSSLASSTLLRSLLEDTNSALA